MCDPRPIPGIHASRAASAARAPERGLTATEFAGSASPSVPSVLPQLSRVRADADSLDFEITAAEMAAVSALARADERITNPASLTPARGNADGGGQPDGRHATSWATSRRPRAVSPNRPSSR